MLFLKKLYTAFTLSLLFIIYGCVPEGVMRTWSTTENYDRKFTNLMVMGLVNDVSLRSDMEAVVVEAARKTGLKSGKSINMFPPELGKPFEDVERVKSRLRLAGYDGVVTVALIDIKAARYTDPSFVYEPLVFYNQFRNYYYRTYNLVYQPGYTTIYSEYFIETNFYELAEGKLVWSGRSMIIPTSELYEYMPIYARGLFKELALQGVIEK